MFTTFKNLTDIHKAFPDDNACRSYLEQQRWNGTPVCPHCATTATPYKLKDDKTYKCSDKDCKQKFTATVGTIFENTKLPLTKWFLAIYIVSAHKKGISSLQLGRDLGITQKTAWFVLHRVREMLSVKSPVILSGVVEVDETYIGGKEKNKHQSAHAKAKRLEKLGKTKLAPSDNKAIVFGLLERDGKVVNRVVTKADNKNLLPIIQKQIAKGSIMVSDDLNMYRNVVALGYKHEAVKHLQQEYVRGTAHTCTIDGYWSLLKRGIIGIYHQVSAKHLHRYCDEFSYRYNTRKVKDGERFNDCFSGTNGRRLTYKQLTAK